MVEHRFVPNSCVTRKNPVIRLFWVNFTTQENVVYTLIISYENLILSQNIFCEFYFRLGPVLIAIS